MAYYLLFPLYLVLPVLVVLYGLVRLLAPRRHRLQRVVAGASLGCWLGFCVPGFYNVNQVAELVRQTKRSSPAAYHLLSWLGFSGSHSDLMWWWNALVIAFWCALVLGLLAYWSSPRVKAHTPEAIS